MPRRTLVGLALGLGAAVIALLAGQLELVDRFENNTYDLRARRTAQPVPADSPVVVVLIDETSLQQLEGLVGRWPWPRFVHAAALSFLKRAGARAVGYDILFAEPQSGMQFQFDGKTVTGTESDQSLIEAVRDSHNVALMVDATYEGAVNSNNAPESAPTLPGVSYAPGDGFQARPLLTLPFPDLRLVAPAVGHTFLVKESDGSARRMLPFIDRGGAMVPVLGLSALLVGAQIPADAVKVVGDELRIGTLGSLPLLSTPTPSDPVDGQRRPSKQVLLRYPRPAMFSGSQPHLFPTYSFADLLLSEDQSLHGQATTLPLSAFKDKYVFIGVSAAALFDSYQTPFKDATIKGVELHAVLASNVLSHQTMRRSSWVVDTALTVLAGLLVGVMATTLPVSWAVVAAVALAAASGAGLTYAIGKGLWLPVAMPLIAASVALFEGVAWRYFVEDREKRHVRHLFGRYVSKDVIAQLMAEPARANLGGQRRDMSVLFSDIRNFTTASEKGTPEDVVVQLNEYFGEMVRVLFRHNGTLDKFVGDMVMGLFGAPLDDPQHADHAVACALEMMAELQKLNQKWLSEGKQAVDIGIGVNSGDMIAGNIGSEAIMSYTVIGDAVNLGSRLESLNKEHGTHILISEATRSRLTRPIATRPVGDIKVKGKTEAVLVHEVLWTGNTWAGALAPASSRS